MRMRTPTPRRRLSLLEAALLAAYGTVVSCYVIAWAVRTVLDVH